MAATRINSLSVTADPIAVFVATTLEELTGIDLEVRCGPTTKTISPTSWSIIESNEHRV